MNNIVILSICIVVAALHVTRINDNFMRRLDYALGIIIGLIIGGIFEISENAYEMNNGFFNLVILITHVGTQYGIDYKSITEVYTLGIINGIWIGVVNAAAMKNYHN
jgi:xanthine/uracil permease